MAVNFNGQRCLDCQGSLVYNKTEKYWECPYCGKVYERELRFDKVQIDGLAGINDLVRSALSKLIALDFDGAEKELMECERINHTSIGTLIASISVALFKSFFTKDRQQELSRANGLLQKLSRDFPDIDDSEEILYEFIKSADIYALLYIVFSMTDQTERRDMISRLLYFDEIYNPNVVKILLGIVLKEGNAEAADIIVDKMPKAGCRGALATLLTSYPENERKADNVCKLLSRIDTDTDLSKTFDDYFSSTNDSNDVVVDIFVNAVAHGAEFDTTALIGSVLQRCVNAEKANELFDAIGSNRLNGDTATAILVWLVCYCDNYIVSEIGFQRLFRSNSVFEITDKEVMWLFNTDQSEALKCCKLNQLLTTFKISNKSMDKLVAFHLISNPGSYDYRKAIFDTMTESVVSIPLTVVEDYALKTSHDGENKHIFLYEAITKSRNVSLGTGIFSQYMKSTVDSPQTRDAVIYSLLSLKLVPDPEAVSHYLLNPDELHSPEVLDLMINLSCKTSSGTLDRYLYEVAGGTPYDPRIAKIATLFGFTLSVQSFTTYLFDVSEPDSLKIPAVQKYYQACSSGVKELSLNATVGDTEITGNIAQIYLLKGNDEPFVMQEILKIFTRDKIKLDTHVVIPATRKKIKLRKFIDSNASHLNKKILTLAHELL